MKSPKVSILTATYNSLPGLRETVKSVAGQTVDDYEHIVVDGGSTDGTREWLESYEGDLQWISEPDEGIADALNKGIDMSHGGWLLVLHAEDTFIESRSLELAMETLETEADIVSQDVLFVTKGGSRRYVSHGFSPRINFKTTIPHQGAFCRSTLFDQIGNYDTTYRIGLDYEFFLRAFRAGAQTDVIHRSLSRMPDTGISSRLDWASLRGRFSEERSIHLRHCSSPSLRVAYSVYWPLYLTYRRIRYLASARGRQGRSMGSP